MTSPRMRPGARQPFATKRLRADYRADHRSFDIEIADGCQTLHACSRPGYAAVKPHSQAKSLCVHSLDGFDQRPGLPHCPMDDPPEPFSIKFFHTVQDRKSLV